MALILLMIFILKNGVFIQGRKATLKSHTSNINVLH